MARSIVVYGLIAVYVATERLLRQGRAATSLEEQATDKGSTRAIAVAIALSSVALESAPLLNRRRITALPGRRTLFPLGVSAMVSGLVVRGWANLVLGASYTRTLRVATGQRVIQAGPYAHIRHPGYLGTLLVWLGAAVALANGISLGVVAAVMLRAYGRRMAAEELMLLDVFGEEYRHYVRRTSRLVPHLY